MSPRATPFPLSQASWAKLPSLVRFPLHHCPLLHRHVPSGMYLRCTGDQCARYQYTRACHGLCIKINNLFWANPKCSGSGDGLCWWCRRHHNSGPRRQRPVCHVHRCFSGSARGRRVEGCGRFAPCCCFPLHTGLHVLCMRFMWTGFSWWRCSNHDPHRHHCSFVSVYGVVHLGAATRVR